MTSPDSGRSTERPVILGAVSSPRAIRPPRGGTPKVRFVSLAGRRQRLEDRFEAVSAAFDDQVQLAQSLPAADPQLVLVFEALDERTDVAAVADKLGIEILVETDSTTEPDEEFELVSQGSSPNISYVFTPSA